MTPSQAATPMTAEVRAETLVAQLMDCDGGCEVEKGNYCPGGEDLWENCKAERVIVAAAIHAAEVAKVNEKLAAFRIEMERWRENDRSWRDRYPQGSPEYEKYSYGRAVLLNVMNHAFTLKLSPSPEKEE